MVKKNSLIITFLSFACLILVLEGTGVKNGRFISYLLILVLPYILFFISSRLKKLMPRHYLINIPKNYLWFIIPLVFFSVLSIINAADKRSAVELFLYYYSLFFIYIFISNHAELLFKSVIKLIFLLSFIFLFDSFLITWFIEKRLINLLPTNGYQFVQSLFGSHNHLGDFLILSVILSFFYAFVNHQKQYFIFVLLFFPGFILSFSRSAYVSFILSGICLIIIFFRRTKKYRTGITFLILLMTIIGIFLFSVVNGGVQPINRLLVKYAGLKNKTVLAFRDQFFNQAIIGMKEKPLIGVGPGNFYQISNKYAPNHWSFSSHNLFLDLFTENGIIVGLIISVFITQWVIIAISHLFQTDSNKTSLSLIFLAMFIVMQTDYIHRIYSFLFLFIVLAGIIDTTPTSTTIKVKYLLIGSFLPFLAVLLIIISGIFQHYGFHQGAFFTNPFNQSVYQSLVKNEIRHGNYANAWRYEKLYRWLFPESPDFSPIKSTTIE